MISKNLRHSHHLFNVSIEVNKVPPPLGAVKIIDLVVLNVFTAFS
jgi:hypothetical protein